MDSSDYLPKAFDSYGEHLVMSPHSQQPESDAPAIAATQDIFFCVPGH
jgi:23S rRNA G2069 N7-methylase RlmK/C1962 C5-methylase RlmI